MSAAAIVVLLWLSPFSALADELPRDYSASVSVSAPTRLDWVFVLANQSPAETPAGWLTDYESTAQKYELFVPPKLDPRKAAPLVLFISPGADPAGWQQWEKVCRQSGVVFASPFGAGNDCPPQRRIRIVLDVLDDIRRKVQIDPERTYIGGFSGGGRVSCMIAFALPELFGGIVPVCGAERLRDEIWLRHRAIDRLSVALMTGESDFNRSEIERWRGTLLRDLGVRTKTWTVASLGHAIPNSPKLTEAYRWLDEAAAARRKQAADWPARIASNAAPTREEWSQSLLKEAKQRLEKPATLYSGLMQLQGLSTRWSDLPAAQEAKAILTEYDARKERPWEADDIAEQRKFLLAEARALDLYATGPLPKQYAADKPKIAKAALERWRLLLADGPDSPIGKEAAKRIAELEPLTE